jgi:single-stranded DNA-binding protein
MPKFPKPKWILNLDSRKTRLIDTTFKAPVTMGPKRNHNAVTAGDDNDSSYSSSNKRRREQQNSKPKQVEGKPDPTYGQRTAFPGLDDDGSAQISDDDLEFEANAEALAYLRAVR